MIITSLVTDGIKEIIVNIAKKQKWKIIKNWLIKKYTAKYINPFVDALSIYESSLNNRLDNISKTYIVESIFFEICSELFIATKFWIKNYLNTKYICINDLVYDLSTVYKTDTTCLKELLQLAWNNIFQYISLNQDVLKNGKLKNELNNIIKELETLNIDLPIQYKDITSDNKENLREYYIFAHKQFIENNIGLLCNYSCEIIIDWCKKNQSNYPYNANIISHLFGNNYNELFRDILKIYLSNNINNNKETLDMLLKQLEEQTINERDRQFVLISLKIRHDYRFNQ